MDHLLWGDEDSSKVDECIFIAEDRVGSSCPDLKKMNNKFYIMDGL